MKAIQICLLLLVLLVCGCEKENNNPTPTPAPGTTTTEQGPLEGFWIVTRTQDNTGKVTNFTENSAAITRFKGNQTFTIFMSDGSVECAKKYRPFTFEIPNLTLQGIPECVTKAFDSVRIFGTVNSPELNMRRISDDRLFFLSRINESDFNTLIRNRGYSVPQ